MGTTRILEATGSMNGLDAALHLIEISRAFQPVSATGLLGVDILVLIDTRTGERDTYRKR